MYFQRYSAGGTKLGGETRVNSNGTTVQFAPSVAALENGRFVVVWTSPDDGSGSGVYMQRYDADGLPLGKAKRCNTFTTGNQAMPSVSALSNGGYIVAWRSSGQDGSGTGIYGQRFDSFGTKVGAGFRLNTNTFLDQTHPRVAGLDNGGFVGAWNSDNQDGDGYGPLRGGLGFGQPGRLRLWGLCPALRPVTVIRGIDRGRTSLSCRKNNPLPQR